MNALPLCSPVEFQVSLTFMHHLNYKWVAGIYAWIRSAARLPNKQSIDGRSKTRQFQRPSGKKTLSLSQLIRSHLYCYERTKSVPRIQGLEPMSLLVNCPTRWSLLLLIGYWCRSSSWRWQPHIRGCRLHYPLPRAEMRFLVQFFSKMYLLYVSIWWKNWKPHFFAIFNPSKTQFSWTLWDHLATFPDLRFHLAGTSNPEK